MTDMYYEILGVNQKASLDDIKKAYRNLAKKYHPDSRTGNADKFRKLNEAYVILSNEKTRKDYDSLLNKSKQNNKKPSYDTSIYESREMQNIINELQKTNYSITELSEVISYLVDSLAEINEKNKETDRELIECIKFLVEANESKRRPRRDPVAQETDWYYSDPSKESIFTILFHFNDYRFENAVSALWKRWAISMFGASFVYVFALPFVLITKILFFLRPRKERNFSIHWLSHVHNLMYRNHLITSIFWFVFLLVLGVLRIVWTTLYITYWIFKNIIRFFLFPVAIILATLIRVFGRLVFNVGGTASVMRKF